jgi:hypothetical protein
MLFQLRAFTRRNRANKNNWESNQDATAIGLHFVRYTLLFRHPLPAQAEFTSLKQQCWTQGDTPWNPSSLSDQVADKLIGKLMILNLSMQIVWKCFFMIRLTHTKIDLNGKPATLIFCPNIDTGLKSKNPASKNTDPQYSKSIYNK